MKLKISQDINVLIVEFLRLSCASAKDVSEPADNKDVLDCEVVVWA
jgi:hypothetical protein